MAVLKEANIDLSLCVAGHNPDGLAARFLAKHRHHKVLVRDYGKKTYSEH